MKNHHYWRVTYIFPSNNEKGRANDSYIVPYEVAKTEEEAEKFFKELPVFNGTGNIKEVAEIIKIEEINTKVMENIISYAEFLNEDAGGGGAAMAGAGTTSGMGNVASSQPASTPGAAVTGDGTTGSGDYGNPLFPTAQKDGSNTLGKKRGKKSKKDKKKESVIQNFIAQHKAGKTKNGATTSDDVTTSSKMLSFSDFVNNDIKK